MSSPASFLGHGWSDCAAHHESSLRSRQSRLIDIGEINTKSPTNSLSWRALWRHELFIATVGWTVGTSTSTIKRMSCARAAGFGRLRRMDERCNLMKHDNRTRRIWFAFLGNVCKTRKKRTPDNNDPKTDDNGNAMLQSFLSKLFKKYIG